MYTHIQHLFFFTRIPFFLSITGHQKPVSTHTRGFERVVRHSVGDITFLPSSSPAAVRTNFKLQVMVWRLKPFSPSNPPQPYYTFLRLHFTSLNLSRCLRPKRYNVKLNTVETWACWICVCWKFDVSCLTRKKTPSRVEPRLRSFFIHFNFLLVLFSKLGNY